MEANAKARASESREVLLQSVRNTAARLLAQAVVERYPSAKLGECGLTDHGFYYDFDLGADEAGQRQSLRTQDLEALRGRMQALVSEDRPIEVARPAAAEALDLFAGQPYKQELVNEAAGTGAPEIPEAVEVYRQGEFVDLGPGPFLPSTGGIDPSAIELLSISSAYWRGEESNPAMQRVYGAAWLTKAELDKFLEEREAARKIDHRVLGKELDIFFFDDDVGPGLPLFTPRGTVLIEEIERLAKEVEGAAGYERVKTPHVTKDKLFLRSGHLPYYAKSMFPPMEIEGEMYYIKPMNCPFHHKIYAERPRSYRDLPLRLAEYGTCYRYEKSGELMGLMRVRAMQMNDAHIYCTVDQFEEEFLAVVRMYQEYFTLFGIEKYKMRFSTHAKSELGKKYVDNEALWVQTEDMVRRALINAVIPYEEVADEAAFYGPKIDVQIWSATGREFTPRHEPGRFRGAGALQPDVHQRRGQGRDAPVHPPRAAQHTRAAHRLPHRTLRGQFPPVARARAGPRGARRDGARGLRGTGPAGPRRRRPPRLGRPALRHPQREDPRRGADEGAVHRRGGPARGRERDGVGPPPRPAQERYPQPRGIRPAASGSRHRPHAGVGVGGEDATAASRRGDGKRGQPPFPTAVGTA
jgi:threonyl-tRNA synthetase